MQQDLPFFVVSALKVSSMINKARLYMPRGQDSFLFEKTALGIQTHNTQCSRRALYQLSYQRGPRNKTRL